MPAVSPMPRIYSDLAEWWPLLSAPEDYAEEAEVYRQVFESHVARPIETMLELGSGGGNNASHLKAHYRMTLVDVAPGMLEVSRALNPDCQHVLGDMRSVRLDETFDTVFIHDAVDYMTSEDDLAAVMDTAATHCRPGGVALFVPDYVTESFRPIVGTGGHDGDGRGLRYLEWMWDPDPSDTTFRSEYVVLLRDGDDVRSVHETHTFGLFPSQTWLDSLTDAGFGASTTTVDLGAEVPTHLFIGVRPLA